MTATIPRPNWPDLRQRASMLVARITGRPVDATIAQDIARQRTLQREEQARQWAAVMTERGGRTTAKTGRATKKAAGPAAAGTQLTETTAQAPAVPVATARDVAAKRAPAGKRAPIAKVAKVAEPSAPAARPSAPVIAARTATSARPTPVEVPLDSAPWPPVALDDTGPLPRVSAPLAADPPSVRAPIVASAPVRPAPPAAPPPAPVAPVVPTVSAVDAPAARAAAASTATAQAATERSAWLRISTAWVLPVMLTIVCGMAAIWSQASGPAAAGWLVATITTGFFGVPLVLVLMRLFGVDDSSD